jgi:hypothetical protein
MIALGLLVEAVAAIAVVVGILLGDDGVGVLWVGAAAALVGLLLAMIGVGRARPPLRPWRAAQPGVPADRG